MTVMVLRITMSIFPLDATETSAILTQMALVIMRILTMTVMVSRMLMMLSHLDAAGKGRHRFRWSW